MIASPDDPKPPKTGEKKRPEQSDVDSILSDPEIRAALLDVMAGLTEAFTRLAKLESERRDRESKRAIPGAKSSSKDQDTKD